MKRLILIALILFGTGFTKAFSDIPPYLYNHTSCDATVIVFYYDAGNNLTSDTTTVRANSSLDFNAFMNSLSGGWNSVSYYKVSMGSSGFVMVTICSQTVISGSTVCSGCSSPNTGVLFNVCTGSFDIDCYHL